MTYPINSIASSTINTSLVWRGFVTTARISLLGLKNRHGHYLCWMSTGRNNGLMSTTHTAVYTSSTSMARHGRICVFGVNTYLGVKMYCCCCSHDFTSPLVVEHCTLTNTESPWLPRRLERDARVLSHHCCRTTAVRLLLLYCCYTATVVVGIGNPVAARFYYYGGA